MKTETNKYFISVCDFSEKDFYGLLETDAYFYGNQKNKLYEFLKVSLHYYLK